MARGPITDEEILSQIPSATERARRSDRLDPRAEHARFSRTSRTLHVHLTNGISFCIPIALLPRLAKSPDAALARVRVGWEGSALFWDGLNEDLSVVGLARFVFGTQTLMRAAGSVGGSSRSMAKVQASQRTGVKGGWLWHRSTWALAVTSSP